jgi:hypothetical protein
MSSFDKAFDHAHQRAVEAIRAAKAKAPQMTPHHALEREVARRFRKATAGRTLTLSAEQLAYIEARVGVINDRALHQMREAELFRELALKYRHHALFVDAQGSGDVQAQKRVLIELEMQEDRK